MRAPPDKALNVALRDWGLTIDPSDRFTRHITAVHTRPPLLRVANFLTSAQCDALVALQTTASAESDLYLNYRVNRQLAAAAVSDEAAQLIARYPIARETLSPTMRSGFRAQVPPDADELRPVLDSVRDVLGFGARRFVFAEGMWVRPNTRSVVVRDQTTVRYDVGEGVAPHVDGKDVTVLVCLQEPDQGGRTVFPEEGLAIKPEKGAALVYESKQGLLHFAEAVGKGRKWVLQLLIDFRVRRDEMDVDYESGSVFS